MIEVKDATLCDAEKILEIYDYYVKNTAISFEYETPTVVEFKNRMKTIMEKYPYIVITDNEQIKGYAYARPFVGRKAYEKSCELTIYIDHTARRLGLGGILYDELQNRLSRMGIINLYACIAYPEKDDEYLTKNSALFHKRKGFNKVGKFHKCGYKFGRWYDMIWMEKIIAKHTRNQAPLIPYRELPEND